MPIYDKIRQLCKERGETITGVEKQLGFARGSLSKIDKNRPSAERIEKLAKHFGLAVEYFMPNSSNAQKDGQSDWYIDPETAKIAQEVFSDPDKRVLFDAARTARPEAIRFAAQLLEQWKETNPNG